MSYNQAGGNFSGYVPPSVGDFGPGNGDYSPPPTVRFEIIGEAWGLFQQQMGTWIVATLIFMLLSFVIGGITGVVHTAMFPPSYPGGQNLSAASIATQILFSLLTGFWNAYIVAGLYTMALKQLRGETIGVGDLFAAGRFTLPIYGIQLMVGLVVAIPVAACIAPVAVVAMRAHQPALIVTGGVVAVVAVFVLAASLVLAPFLLVEGRASGPISALQESWNALKGQFLSAALFYFVVSLVAGVGFIACFVGGLFTYPLLPLSLAILYRDFFGIESSGTGSPGYPAGYPTGTEQPWASPPQGPGVLPPLPRRNDDPSQR